MLPAVAAGPGRGNAPVCLGCLRSTGVHYIPNAESLLHKTDEIYIELSACSKCSWPVCSKECEESLDHKEECKIFSSNNLKWEGSFTEKTHKLDFIGPLRLLLKLKENPKLKNLLKYDMKTEARRKRNQERFGPTADKDVIQIIQEKCKIKEFTETDIESAMGLFELHSVSMDCGAESVHEDTPSINHSCSPNTYKNSLSNFGVIYRASRPIKRGEVITTASQGILDLCNLFRRRKLLKEFLVDCQCPRCCDGSEFGTGYGGLLCNKCSMGGVLNPTDSRNESSDWKCEKCEEKKKGQECITILENLKKKMDEAVADYKIGTYLFYESVIQGDGDWKHCSPNSQFVVEAMKQICYIYQYEPQFAKPSFDELRVKDRYCKEILSLYKKLFPGWSYTGSLIEYEEIHANQTMINRLTEDGVDQATRDVYIYKTFDYCSALIEFLKLEEDRLMIEKVVMMNNLAVEAKEEQRQKVYLWMMDDEEEEDW